MRDEINIATTSDETQLGHGRSGKPPVYQHNDACFDTTIAVKGTGNGPLTVGASTSLKPILAHGQPGIIPGGNYSVRVVVTVTSDATKVENSAENVVKAGIYSPEEPKGPKGTKEACGCGPTTGTEPEEFTKESC